MVNLVYTYRRDREELSNSMQLRLGDGFSAEGMKSIGDVDEIDIRLRRNGDIIWLSRMPFDCMERVKIISRKDTQDNSATNEYNQWNIEGVDNSCYSRNIIPDDFRKLPNDEASI
jgi:hypothetical protein